MTKLDLAFKLMRKEGLLAKQNFACCSNCAGTALTNLAVERISKGKNFTGTVFYHRQDSESRREGKGFYISYGPLDSTEYGLIGFDSLKVGRITMKCLKEAGVEFEWNENPDERIFIKPGY